jgi:hypothetical protein
MCLPPKSVWALQLTTALQHRLAHVMQCHEAKAGAAAKFASLAQV